MLKGNENKSQEISLVLNSIKEDVRDYTETSVDVKPEKINAVKAAIRKVEQALRRQKVKK